MPQYARKGKSHFKPGKWPAVGGVTISNPHLTRQDIADWTRAVNMARSALFPRRKQLHDLYDNIVLDAHVQSVLLARTAQVANRQIRWFTGGRPEPEGKEDVYKTVISTPWFHNFITGAMSAVAYGTTVLELVLKEGEVHDVAVVPRANVAPEQGLILDDPNQYEGGVRYRDDPYWNRYLIEVGEAKNYGGLMVAAMYVLYKRGGFSNWAQYMELFGMPLRKGTYNPYDDNSRRKLTQALEQMGSASWIVIPEGSDIEFISAPNSSGTGSADLYDKNIERCNAEISKLFLGQTLTTESGSRGARALGEVHQETKNDIAEMDMRRLEFLMNYELRPRLVQLGYPLENGEFHFYEEASIPAKERILVDMQVARQVPIPDSYWYKTYGIPAPTAAELKAMQERKQANVPAALREHQEHKQTKEDEGGDEGDEDDRAFEASLTAELDAYYGLPPRLTAEVGDKAPKGVPAHIWDRIMRGIRNGEITEHSVDPELMQWLLKAFTDQLLSGKGPVVDNAPPELTPEEERQVQVFSGFKTNSQLRKATDALYDADGAMVPWATFKKRIQQIDQAYNVRYLKAEYNLAKANRRAINTWKDAQRMRKVAPFIKYSTVGDDRVREAHRALDGVIKHIDDAFWNVWWPPNGWNCRCTVMPVRSDKGGKPVPPGVVPPKTMFANNVGKNGQLFPKQHPYEEQASEEARKKAEELAEEAMKRKREEAKPKPEEPAKPDVPAPVPEEPATPGPGGVEEPAGPEAPAPVPIVPAAPKGKPAKPVTPGKPQQPVPKQGPAAPVEPQAKPGKPAEPQPGAPTKPLKPAIPVDKRSIRSLCKPPLELAEDAGIAFAAIDRVHAVPGMPELTMVARRMLQAGTYHPRSQRTRIDPTGPYKALTIVHEIGHHLDYHLLGWSIGYGTSREVQRVLQAIQDSEPYKQLKAIQDTGIHYFAGSPIVASNANRKSVVYLLQDKELFARAYAQYIALRSNDPTLVAQVNYLLGIKEVPGLRQWNGTDFEPIAAAFDELFKAPKWTPIK